MGVLKDIWDIKGEIDNAITTKRYYRLKGAKKAFNEATFEGDGTLYTAFTPMEKKEFVIDAFEPYKESTLNIVYMYDNVITSYIDKYVDGKEGVRINNDWLNNSIPAHEVWAIREAYDESLYLACTDGFRHSEVISQGKVIIDRLKSLYERYVKINEAKAQDILEIIDEVKNEYDYRFAGVNEFDTGADI